MNNNPFTPEQRKRMLQQTAATVLLSVGISFLLSHFILKRELGAMDKRVMKLEGWQ